MEKKIALIVGALILLAILAVITKGKVMILLLVGGIAYGVYKYN